MSLKKILTVGMLRELMAQLPDSAPVVLGAFSEIYTEPLAERREVFFSSSEEIHYHSDTDEPRDSRDKKVTALVIY